MRNRITLRLSLSRANRKLRKREEQSNVEPHSTSLTQSADARARQLTHASHPIHSWRLVNSLQKTKTRDLGDTQTKHSQLLALDSIAPENTRAISTLPLCNPEKAPIFVLHDERGMMKDRNRCTSSDKTEAQCRRKPPLLRT